MTGFLEETRFLLVVGEKVRSHLTRVGGFCLCSCEFYSPSYELTPTQKSQIKTKPKTQGKKTLNFSSHALLTVANF